MKRRISLICVIVVTGCIFQGNKLDFETVALGDSSYEGRSPLLFAAQTPEDTLDFTKYTGHESELEQIDYSQYIVICVFLGGSPEGHDIEIKELIRKERSIILLTTFREPEFGKPLSERKISPFHIIAIKISEIGMGGEVSFLLEDTRGFLHAKVIVEID